MGEKIYPIGVQNFEKLRKETCHIAKWVVK